MQARFTAAVVVAALQAVGAGRGAARALAAGGPPDAIGSSLHFRLR
jgi:hypothetical protein